jgi:transposase
LNVIGPNSWSAKPRPFRCREKAVRLKQSKGIGANSAAMLVVEVFGRTFESQRHLAAFLGLAPAPCSSGAVMRGWED